MSCARLFLVLVFFLLSACSPPKPSATDKMLPVAGQALVTAYLSTSGSSLSRASFTIERVALYQSKAWIELDLPAFQVDNKRQRNNQLLLGISLAPAGEYRRLKLQLKDLTIDGVAVLPAGQVETVELQLSEPVSLRSKESQCLFLNWTLDSQEGQKNTLTPVFTAWGQRIQLGAGLAYVACRDLDTIYVLRTDTNELVASFAVPGPIGEIQIDQRSRRLYVISAGSRSIYVYDCIKARLLEQIALPGTVAPGHFVLATDRRTAYVTDSFSSLVLKVDLLTGTVVGQQRVSSRPEKVALISAASERLAVVSPRAQQVSILSADSLAVLRSFSVGQQVSDVVFIAGTLFVVEQAANSVAAYEYQTGRLLGQIPVGFKPSELLVVNQQKVYVGNQHSASLSVLVPGQKTSFRRIPAGTAPGDLGLSKRHQVIYVLSAKNPQLTIVDLPGEYLRQTVPLAGQPTAVAVLE